MFLVIVLAMFPCGWSSKIRRLSINLPPEVIFDWLGSMTGVSTSLVPGSHPSRPLRSDEKELWPSYFGGRTATISHISAAAIRSPSVTCGIRFRNGSSHFRT